MVKNVDIAVEFGNDVASEICGEHALGKIVDAHSCIIILLVLMSIVFILSGCSIIEYRSGLRAFVSHLACYSSLVFCLLGLMVLIAELVEVALVVSAHNGTYFQIFFAYRYYLKFILPLG